MLCTFIDLAVASNIWVD